MMDGTAAAPDGTETRVLTPRLAPAPHLFTFRKWCEVYGYFVDEMTRFVMDHLPDLAQGGIPIVWDPVALWDALARLCYRTSINRFRRFKPVL